MSGMPRRWCRVVALVWSREKAVAALAGVTASVALFLVTGLARRTDWLFLAVWPVYAFVWAMAAMFAIERWVLPKLSARGANEHPNHDSTEGQ